MILGSFAIINKVSTTSNKYENTQMHGVLISGVNLYYKAQFGTFVSVLNTGVSSFQGVLNRGVSLYIRSTVLYVEITVCTQGENLLTFRLQAH